MFQERLDTFFTEFLSEKGFESLKLIFFIIFCLSHGQLSKERGFKSNKEFSAENQSENSLKSLRIIHDHMLAKDVKAHNINVNRDIKSVATPRARYVEFLNENKKAKKESEKDLKRKVISCEIEEVRKKKLRVQSSIDELIKDADELALKAQETNSFQALGRSNDLRRLAKSKKEDTEECNRIEQSLLLRKDSII